MKKLLFAVLAIFALFSAPADAAQSQAQALIVASCGTLPSGVTYAAGTYGILTMDATGKLCDSATGGGGGGGTSAADESTFTAGTTTITPVGGVYWSSIPTLSTGQTGAAAMTPARSVHTLDDNSASILSAVQAAIPAGTNNIGNVGSISQYPAGAVPITASATGTTAATTATLAATSGKTTYICSSSVRANATAATTVTDTITGIITATLSSLLWVAPAASGVGVDEQIFSPCVPASGTNQTIAVVSGAPGSGGNVTVHATGYQL